MFRASEAKRSSWLQHGGKLKKIEAKLFITLSNLVDNNQGTAPRADQDGSNSNNTSLVVSPDLAVRELLVVAKVTFSTFLVFQ